MKLAEIRSAFIDFFVSKGHTQVPSSSLVPAHDPTLLFTNAGMVQFKELFLGQKSAPYPSAVTAQKVVRAGGKHNDLDNVGYTARHHTFFEMLGNFSFGDYFKSQAIAYAWEFLTQVLQIPAEKLMVTVYQSDDEAFTLWHEQVGVPLDRIVRLGEDDNFWSMGDVGPCGPCTEIFYDHGPEIAGGPPGSLQQDGDRYIEIWNIVFMQYDRQIDGQLLPLPKPAVDTGMGLERIAAVLQGVHSNYQIDLFQGLMARLAALFPDDVSGQQSLCVIADHIRACAFLILDGVSPSNEGRGYVLRRIIRRAVRHGRKLGAQAPFFHLCVSPLVDWMAQAYPELREQAHMIESTLLQEETRFLETLEQGLKLLLKAIDDQQGKSIELPGEVAFTLYDTYGFPLDLTMDVAREQGIEVDLPGFELAMAEQKARSKSRTAFSAHSHYQRLAVDEATEFVGYDRLQADNSISLLLNAEGESVDRLLAGESGSVVLPQTPFYAESGGQIGDQGQLVVVAGEGLFTVTHTRKQGQVFVHEGYVKQGELALQQRIDARVDPDIRAAVKANHSATHLLHAALRQVLGGHVQQKGSLVTADRLRFDFSHSAPLSEAQWISVETLVNQHIWANTSVTVEYLDMQSALDKGAMALFGEKYDDQVRVLSMGSEGFSIELCGGTHVDATGEIGGFYIVQETGVAAGVRRIEAVTGSHALSQMQQWRSLIQGLQQTLKIAEHSLVDKVLDMANQLKLQERELARMKVSQAAEASGDMATQAYTIGHTKLLVTRVADALEAKQLREVADQVRQQLGVAIVLLASVHNDNKVQMVCAVESSLIECFKAGDLVGRLASMLGGKGGGKPTLAMAGGKDVQALPSALAELTEQLTAELRSTVVLVEE